VLFFLGMRSVLDSARCLLDHRGRFFHHRFGHWRRCSLFGWRRGGLDHHWRFYRSRLGGHHGFSRSSSGSQLGFLLQALGFTLAATHFAWVVRCTAIAGQGADRRGFGFDSGCGRFGHHRCCNRSRLFNLGRLLGRYRLFNHHCWLGNRGWRRGLLNRRDGLFFNHWRWGYRFCCRLFGNHGLGFDNHDRFGSHFNLSLLFSHWSHFHCRNHWGFYRRGGFNHWGFRSLVFYSGSCTFGLLVSFGFSVGADGGAGNRGSYRKAGSQIGAAWLFGVFFRAFDHIAVGITLTLATVAATTLAAGATTWTFAFGVVLAVFLQLLFVRQRFFFAGGSGLSLLGTWLALFTWRTWLALFARLARRTFFGNNGGGSSGCSWSGVQWLAQFTHAFFTLATWLALFTRGAWLAFFARCTGCAFFAGYRLNFFTGFANFAWLTLFPWCAFFTRSTFFARLALFIAATVTVAALLAAIATLFFVAASRALGHWLLDHDRSGWLFLGSEQADQGLHQAFEQAWFGR